MHFGLPMLGRSLFLLVTHTGEVTKLVASFTLVLLGRTLEPLYVYGITTFGTSRFIIMRSFCVKPLLGLCLQVVSLIALVLVIGLLGLYGCSFLLVLPSWQLCLLVPQKINLCSLRVTCYLLNVVHCSFGTL